MIYLDIDDLLHIGERVLGGPPAVRDLGLLEAACARPQASFGGQDLYPTLPAKAAAMMHSIAKNHALIDGNKRLAVSAMIAFLGVNGFRLTFTQDELYEFALAVATDELEDVDGIAARIGEHLAPRS